MRLVGGSNAFHKGYMKRRWEPGEQVTWKPGESLPAADVVYVAPEHLDEYLALLSSTPKPKSDP